MWEYVKNHKHELLLLLLFIIATSIRLNLNGMPLDHPGNIKAADPFYHSLTIDMILESTQWMYNSYYVSFGELKSINQQPPLAYVESAGVSSITGLPAWVTIYFIVCLFAGLRTFLMYVLSQEFFGNKSISLISAALTVIPLAPHAWLYEVYIGFWIQVIALTLLTGIIWCSIRYNRTRETWLLWVVGVCSAALIATHPQEILFLPLVFAFLTYLILKEHASGMLKIKQLGRLCILPLMGITLLLPWFLYVWKSKGYSLQLNLDPFPTTYLGGITTPGLHFFPSWYLAIVGLGLIIAIVGWKKYKPLLATTGYYGFYMFVLPYIFASPYYLGRTKTLLPILIAPFAALSIHFVLSSVEKTTHTKVTRFAAISMVSLFMIAIGIPGYYELRQGIQGEHIDQEKWNALTWIHTNTQPNATVLFIEDCGQASCIYTKRITAYIEQKDLPIQAQALLNTHEFSNSTVLSWAADTLWDYSTQEKTPYHFIKLDKEKLKLKYTHLNDFNYIYLRNFGKEIAQFNQQLIQSFLPEYTTQYNKGGIIILHHA